MKELETLVSLILNEVEYFQKTTALSEWELFCCTKVKQLIALKNTMRVANKLEYWQDKWDAEIAKICPTDLAKHLYTRHKENHKLDILKGDDELAFLIAANANALSYAEIMEHFSNTNK